MKSRTTTRRTDILSADEEGILAVLREIVAGMRERGVAVTPQAFGAAVIAAGASRTNGSDGDLLSGYAMGGVRFMAREAASFAGSIEVSFFSDEP